MPQQAHQLFLPWLRQGLSASAPAEDTLGAGVPGRVTMQMQMKVNTVAPDPATDTVYVHLYSPGEVVGVDPQSILRTEPAPRYPVFEPNFFPFVEFSRPDFPWLFTPARARSDGKLRPWLVLIAVPRRMGVALSVEPRRQLPVLDVPRSELPDLEDSWAWAHSQVTRPGASTTHTVPELLTQYPSNTLSRLICPRRLEPSTTYMACLVPAFASGRKAGLNEPLSAADETELSPAWLPLGDYENPDVSVQLPVYYHWEFTTGIAGDFESLVRRLEVRVLPPQVGIQTVDLHDPGWGMPDLDPDAPGALMQMGGIFGAPTSRPADWHATARVEFQNELRAILNGPPDVGGSPVVKPPLYGQEYARAERVPDADDPPHWLRELNLDPRYRIAAGMGAMVIRYEQERLMETAWKQLAAAQRTLQEQRRLQFRSAVNGALVSKRLEALSVPAGAASGFRGLEAEGVERVLVSTANGSLARRLQARGRLSPDHGAVFLHNGASRAGERSLETSTVNTVEPYRFSPSFPTPVLEWIRDYFPDMLLPGLSLVPPNTIALLESNPALLEAFMVGLNHEMGRELLWREFPVDRRGTFFQNLWGDAAAANELPPIAEWTPESHLGDHLQQGVMEPPDAGLEAQIQAAQSQIADLQAQLALNQTQLDSLEVQRETTYDAGETERTQLLNLRLDEAAIPTRQFELATATEAAAGFEALAGAAVAEAADIRAALPPLLADLAALQAIAAQIPAIEASLQALQQQIVDLTGQIEGIPALRAQLEQQRDAAQTAITTTQATIADIQAQVATIPDLQQQVTVAEQEAAQHEAEGNNERNIASQIRETVAPQRQRLAELALMAEEAVVIKDKLIDLTETLIPQKEEQIRLHREQEPPPPDGKGIEPEAIGPELPGPGWTWDEWYRRLLELEEELAILVRDRDDHTARLEQIMLELEEVPVLQAQVDAAEQDAAPHDQAAALAYHLAAQSQQHAHMLRLQITTIEGRASQIPALELEIQNQQQIVADRSQQIENLPAYQAGLENQRAQAQSEADTVAANLADVQAQVAGMPSLQAEIADIEALAAEQDSAAANYTAWAAEEEAKIQPLNNLIAALQSAITQIPAVTAQVQANNTAVAAIVAQLDATLAARGALNSQLAAGETELSDLLNQRTLSRSQLVLVIRGDLLRRFARARIYAVEAMWTNPEQSERAPDPAAEPLQPLFRQSWGNDLTFFGFSMTGTTARGAGGHPGWYFIIEEPPTGARFGLDAAQGTHRTTGEITAWDTLSWDDLVNAPEELPDLMYATPNGRLSNLVRPVFTDPGDDPPVNAHWGRNSAHIALITRQRPARMEIHASRWLP